MVSGDANPNALRIETDKAITFWPHECERQKKYVGYYNNNNTYIGLDFVR